MKPSLVRLEPILEIIRAAIWTGKLADEKPVSVMLVAQQESAKTAAMKHFKGTPTLRYFSDITGNGLMAYKKDIESFQLRHFMLNDLTRILSHSKGVGERTLQTFATLMEEGESETADPSGKTTWENWPTVGVIMGITPEFYKARQRRWRSTGFMTRFLPVSFHYKEGTSDLIHAHIRTDMTLPESQPIKFRDKGLYFVKIPNALGIAIEEKAKEIGKLHDTYGFRYHKSMRRLAKAYAASQNRSYVIAKDVERVMYWSKFFGEGQEMIL